MAWPLRFLPGVMLSYATLDMVYRFSAAKAKQGEYVLIMDQGQGRRGILVCVIVEAESIVRMQVT